jgi:hypothetical protein
MNQPGKYNSGASSDNMFPRLKGQANLAGSVVMVMTVSCPRQAPIYCCVLEPNCTNHGTMAVWYGSSATSALNEFAAGPISSVKKRPGGFYGGEMRVAQIRICSQRSTE